MHSYILAVKQHAFSPGTQSFDFAHSRAVSHSHNHTIMHTHAFKAILRQQILTGMHSLIMHLLIRVVMYSHNHTPIQTRAVSPSNIRRIMHSLTHSNNHARYHTSDQSCILTHIRSVTHTHIHPISHAYSHTSDQSCILTHIRTVRTLIFAQLCIQTCMQLCTHIYMQSCTYAQTCYYTHTAGKYNNCDLIL